MQQAELPQQVLAAQPQSTKAPEFRTLPQPTPQLRSLETVAFPDQYAQDTKHTVLAKLQLISDTPEMSHAINWAEEDAYKGGNSSRMGARRCEA